MPGFNPQPLIDRVKPFELVNDSLGVLQLLLALPEPALRAEFPTFPISLSSRSGIHQCAGFGVMRFLSETERSSSLTELRADSGA